MRYHPDLSGSAASATTGSCAACPAQRAVAQLMLTDKAQAELHGSEQCSMFASYVRQFTVLLRPAVIDRVLTSCARRMGGQQASDICFNYLRAIMSRITEDSTDGPIYGNLSKESHIVHAGSSI